MALHRRAARRDGNEREIIEALLLAGASVRQLSEEGVPDLLVGYAGCNFLLEVKAPGGRVTDDQFEFFETWRGQCEVVRTIEEALKAIGVEHGTDHRDSTDSIDDTAADETGS